MTLNELGSLFESKIEIVAIWMYSGYDNLFGAGDFGELTIGQVIFTVFISIVIYGLLLVFYEICKELIIGLTNSIKNYRADKDPWNQ